MIGNMDNLLLAIAVRALELNGSFVLFDTIWDIGVMCDGVTW